MGRARWHIVHIVSAVVIAILLGIHMVIQHLDGILNYFGAGGGEPTSWVAMIGRSSRGIWAGIYITLLAFILYHALYGLRGIILEVTISQRAERLLNILFIIAGIIVFIWGSYVPLSLLAG